MDYNDFVIQLDHLLYDDDDDDDDVKILILPVIWYPNRLVINIEAL